PVTTLAVLLPLSGSATEDVTLAWLATEPGFCGLTLISTVALWPFVTVPREQVTVPLACEQVPCEGVAESNVTPEGRVSVTCTPVAVCGPVSTTSSAYVSCVPASTG